MEFDNQYLTYAEYTELGGTLEETPFNILEAEAQFNIDRYTFGRLKELAEQKSEVKLCILNLISRLKYYAEYNNTGNKLSENTDGYSVTYGAITSDLTNAQAIEVKNLIKVYLSECKTEDGTPYLYPGV